MVLSLSIRFDIAGAGACLKRYSDPSFFKTNSVSSDKIEKEVQIEKKSRKIKVSLSNMKLFIYCLICVAGSLQIIDKRFTNP